MQAGEGWGKRSLTAWNGCQQIVLRCHCVACGGDVSYLYREIGVLPDSSNEWIYCAHLDGKLSTWRRKHYKKMSH